MKLYHKIKQIAYIVLLASLCLLAACKKTPATSSDVFVVSEATESRPLFYEGIIEPKNLYSISSPVDGTLDKSFIQFGEMVHKGQLLLVVRSPKLEQDYQTAFTDFLKAKEQLADAVEKFKSEQLLWKNGIIARDEFETAKTNVDQNQLTFAQASKHFKSVLSTLGNNTDALFNSLAQLDLAEHEKIQQVLSADHQVLPLHAPADGIVLRPTESEDKSKPGSSLTAGASVKADDALMMIGDISGITLSIDVSEVDIDDIVLGQKVAITGVAFPDVTLQGSVTSIDAEALQEGGGLPVFPVIITVNKVDDALWKKIHVGMSAKLSILQEKKNAIAVPIDAIHEKAGQAFVTVRDPKTKHEAEVPVKTGQTGVNTITILEGVKPGDHIVVPRKSH